MSKAVKYDFFRYADDSVLFVNIKILMKLKNS